MTAEATASRGSKEGTIIEGRKPSLPGMKNYSLRSGSAYKDLQFIFPDHVIWKFAPAWVTLWGLQKGSGDCKNAGADQRHAICASLRQHVC